MTESLALGTVGRGLWPRLAGLVAIGTRPYPPKTRRRLKSVNVGAFTVVVSCLLFALTYALQDATLYHDAIFVNLAMALVCASVPVFHRINDVAGSLVITFGLLAGLFLLVALVGRLSGIQVNFVAASAAIFLIFELKRIRLIAFLIAVAIALHVASWVMFKEGAVAADPRFLLQLYITVVVTISIIIAVLVYYAFWTAEQAEAETESLLLRILPVQIAERLKARPEAAIADNFEDASVLFSDIVGFVPISRSLGARRTVAMLNHLFKRLDRLAAEHGVEKIKTIGDAYMAVSGVPHPTPDHAARLARMALGMHEIAEKTGREIRSAVEDQGRNRSGARHGRRDRLKAIQLRYLGRYGEPRGAARKLGRGGQDPCLRRIPGGSRRGLRIHLARRNGDQRRGGGGDVVFGGVGGESMPLSYCPRCAWLAKRRASSAARKTPAALAMHSCCSDSGFESATMPAPACT